MRVGIVVGGSVHKKAARRNFWKRQVRAALGPRKNRRAGYDLLVLLRPKVTTLTKKRFQEAMSAALARLQL